MAPLKSLPGGKKRRWQGEKPREARRLDLYRRQEDEDNNDNNRGGDGGDGRSRGRGRFGFGNNNGGNGRGNNDDDGQRGGGGFFGGGRNGGNGNGNGGGGFGSGNGSGGRNGNRFGNGNNNQGGDGNGGGNNNDNDNSNGRGDGNGNGFRFGNGRGGGRGFGFGNRFGDGDRGNNRGGGFGRNRNGDDDNDNDNENESDDTTSAASSATEAPTSSSSPTEPPAESPAESPTETPQPAASTDPAPSSEAPPAITPEVSSESNPGVVLLQPAVTGNSDLEPIPTVTQFIPLMSPSDAVGPTSIPELEGTLDPGAAPSDTLGTSPSPTLGFPSTGGPMDNSGPTSNGRGDDAAGNRLEVAEAGMDPTVERILVSVGSIGGFILLCFVAWMIWRTMKNTRRDRHLSRSGDGLPTRAGSKLSFFRRRGWQNLDQSTVSQSEPPSYYEKAGSARVPSAEGFYSSEKLPIQAPPQQQWPQNTTEGVTLPGHGSIHSGVMYRPSLNTVPGRPQITLMTNIPAVYAHQAQGSFSSTNAAHFGAIATPDSTASPIVSGISPASYYNQPLLNQRYTAPYNNQIYRQPSQTLSDGSSISSGFGDGDIIVTDPLIPLPAPTAVPGSATNSPQQKQQSQYTTRFSWMTAAEQTATAGGGAAATVDVAGQTAASLIRKESNASTDTNRRETIYTQTSEDQPARFRSVASWVDQQKGRIKRVQQRGMPAAETLQGQAIMIPGNPGIPGVHNPPREQSFDLMMDDEEKPRRVDEVVAELKKIG
ncbi:hypothetical protein VTI28DRAFT_7983 [Corynascus sepedonium]